MEEFTKGSDMSTNGAMWGEGGELEQTPGRKGLFLRTLAGAGEMERCDQKPTREELTQCFEHNVWWLQASALKTNPYSSI